LPTGDPQTRTRKNNKISLHLDKNLNKTMLQTIQIIALIQVFCSYNFITNRKEYKKLLIGLLFEA
jgi:hypothetical protein